MLASWHVGARRRTSLQYVATQSSTVERSLVRYFAPLCLMSGVVATYHQELRRTYTSSLIGKRRITVDAYLNIAPKVLNFSPGSRSIFICGK